MRRRGIEPAYLRIASMLRADIASGRLAPGSRLPSETQLMMRHEVSVRREAARTEGGASPPRWAVAAAR
jgi:DNA-binding GntR family transcriptional regulator